MIIQDYGIGSGDERIRGKIIHDRKFRVIERKGVGYEIFHFFIQISF